MNPGYGGEKKRVWAQGLAWRESGFSRRRPSAIAVGALQIKGYDSLKQEKTSAGSPHKGEKRVGVVCYEWTCLVTMKKGHRSKNKESN